MLKAVNQIGSTPFLEFYEQAEIAVGASTTPAQTDQPQFAQRF